MFQEAQSYLENIIVNAPIGIITTDCDTRIRLMSPAATRMHNVENAEEWTGREFKTLIAEGSNFKTQVQKIFNQEESKITIPYETRLPQNRREIESTVTLLRNEQYSPIGLLLMCEDVTEKRQLEAKLVETQKLALIGQMAVALQHEINNPLQTILGYAEMLSQGFAADDPRFHQAEIICEHVRRIASLLDKIGRISRVETVTYLGDQKMLDIEASSR